MKITIHGFILFLIFCEFQGRPDPDELKNSQQILDASQDGHQETNPIKIGLILDANSWVGKVVQSSITMAISDFSKLNRHYKTSIALETRDSRGETLHSIAAAFDLLENAEVHAIIVPELSSEELFLARLCDKANVPLLSFSSVSSFNEHPYLFQVAQDEITQFKGIAAFVKEFKWRSVVLIYEGTADAGQFLSSLLETFQDYDVHVIHVAVTLRATDDQIIDKLRNLISKRTPIIIVHTSVSLASQIFVNAKRLGLVSEDYAWILTSKTTNLLDFQESAVVESMEGVVGFKSYIPASSKLQDFTLRWRREFQHSEIDMESKGFNVFGIWTYDGMWALADAIERARIKFFPTRNWGGGFKLNLTNLDHIRVSYSGSALLKEMLSSFFTGLGGEFRLINGKLVHEAYEIVNVIGEGGRRVGFWTPACGFTKEIYQSTNHCSSDGLKTIIWPGFSTTAPKRGLLQMSGKPLRIAVTSSTFNYLVRVHVDPITNQSTFSGFCIEVFHAAVQMLPHAMRYQFIPIPFYKVNGSYSDLLNQVSLQEYDAAVGDITVTPDRYQYVDFTLPFTELGVGMVTRLENKDPWFFLKPLSVDLWIASAGFFILTGFIVWLIEHPHNEEFQGSLAWQIGTILWFAASTLVYAHRERLQSNLSRFVVSVWLFVVLILASSYTANLSSLLTVQQIKLSKNDYIGYSGSSLTKGIIANNINFKDNRLKLYNSPKEFDEALRKGSKKGGVGAIVEEMPYINIFLAMYPHEYVVLNISEKTYGFAFAFPKGSPLVQEMSRAIAKLREEGKLSELENNWYISRPSSSSQEGNESPKTNTLDMNSFSGLFLVSGISKAVALILFLIFVLHEKFSIEYYIITLLARGKLKSIFMYLFPGGASMIGATNAR